MLAVLAVLGGTGQFPPILGGLALAACLAVVTAGLLKRHGPVTAPQSARSGVSAAGNE